MNLKQHNNIVQKLIEQIQSKDKQITNLNKQLHMQSKQITSQPIKSNDPTQTEKLIQKRISQLNKQHQSKLSTLNQQIKTLTQQNTQLKQRLTLKTQIQAKDRQRIVEVLKRNMIERKQGSKEDEKIFALVGYYEGELGKKNNMIETLKRQVKALGISAGQGGKMNCKTTKEQQQLPKQQSQEQQLSTSISSSRGSQSKGISLTEHKKAISSLTKQLQSFHNKLQDKTNQLISLKTKYNQLTQQYYRVVNQCGDRSQQLSKKINISKSKWNVENVEQSVASVSVDLELNFKRFNERINASLVQQQQQEQDEFGYKPTRQPTVAHNLNNQTRPTSSQLIQSIMSLLNITINQRILPTISQLIAKDSCSQQVITTLQQFLSSFGLENGLSRFTQMCNKWVEANHLLEEVCIEIGANRSKLIERINFYKSIEQQYNQKMRTLSFLNSLNKSQKLLQFINFFQLDKSDLQLPQQLRNIYQQLKQVDRFVKLANSIMGISSIRDNSSLQNTLNVILRKLERYSSWEVELEKENQRKRNNIKKKETLSTHLQSTTIKHMQ